MAFRIVVLVSGSGTLLQRLIDTTMAGEIDAEIMAVGSDALTAQGIARAVAAGIPTFTHPYEKNTSRARWDAELRDLVAQYQPDLVVCAGFMKLLGADFLAEFGGRTINSHPSLLPSFPGTRAPADALEHGVKITGTTVFWVDEGVDTGKIIAQESVPVLVDDTVETLHERIKVVERNLLTSVVADLAKKKE
ncbi:MAG: phosphoribosylglycinamide formyltransferase [Propionibacteriales bacterium]|nr:MAG: phosphoribosylglycinamide formyltransferase [Propionibacteriales bacterium]